jgi:cell division protein FtsI (penicillin-binding protein 3)/stage V sporulation protein D (sporulation-specific penicillin-binding protein)
VTVELPAGRGAILDREGAALAMGTQATTVYADPLRIRRPWTVALAAGKALGADADALNRELSDRTTRFVYVERQADPDQARTLQEQHLPGLGFYPEEHREYPQHDIASHVLGYAGIDNEGLAGLERRYDHVLAGRRGSQTIVRDPAGRAVDVIRSVTPSEGRDVRLALDRIIQENLQDVLSRTVVRWRAQGATGIVLDPRTGGILGMAVVPRFDANDFGATSPDLTRNRAVTDTYEPGSTFKVVAITGALSEKIVTPESSFILEPEIEVADRVIHEDDRTEVKRMTVADIVAESSNVGAVTLAELLGRYRFAHWIKRFGFGRRTGVDFPGETPGIVVPPRKWSGSSIGNIPIGHGIGVTPVQMAAAYGAVANRGIWTRPHLAIQVGPTAVRLRQHRIMKERIAREVLGMLRGVVTRGSGEQAAVPGYQVAGKTGTAAKPDGHGYSHSRYVASFVGIVPATKPRFVILVAVDEPHGNYYGGTVAAPAFAEIAKFDLQYFGVPPDA